MRWLGCLASLFAMNGRGLVAALVGSVLAAPVVVLGPAPAMAAPVVPCPTEKLSPPPQRPPKPKAPALDPSHAQVGGEALATTGLAVPDGAAAPPKLTASTWLVADLETGQVLGGCNPHGYETPASVQKVLLAATMIPKLDPKQVVQVLREDLDIERGSSAVGLLEGGKYPIETLWYGLLFDSGNDAANVLARVGGGDKGRAGGVAMMNAEARRLGALQTHAVTPSGLDGPGQFTSAYDLVLIARAAFALPDFRRYVATRTAKIPPQPPKDTRGFQIQNDNGLLRKYPGALGGKSGFTTLARHSFVGAAKRGDRTLVAAVLGAEARPIRASDQTAKLLDWGFALPADASVGRLVAPGETDPKPTPSADRPAAAEGAARPSDNLPGSSPAAVIGLAVAVAAVALVMLVAATRRRAVVRARRAALAERRARRGRPDDPDRWAASGARPPSQRRPPDERLWAPEDGEDPRRRPGKRPPPAARRDEPRGGRRDEPRVGRHDEPPGDRWMAGRGEVSGGPRDEPRVGRRDEPPGERRKAGRGEVPGGRRMAGRGEVSDGVYRPVDPKPLAPGGRRGPHPPSGPRPANGFGAPADYYPPPMTDRPARDARARGERPRDDERGAPEGYPPPARRPPAQRRPSTEGPYAPSADGPHAPGDRRGGGARTRGPAAPDPGRPRGDDGWR
jgi:serine-type D-Ala-D-Ala carboxypeptidase (penicillin-binding protein 5/6)